MSKNKSKHKDAKLQASKDISEEVGNGIFNRNYIFSEYLVKQYIKNVPRYVHLNTNLL